MWSVKRETFAALLEAANEALLGMDGGTDDAMCHRGITSREKCGQCRRVDGLRAAIAEAEHEGGE
jgi:hypothetical protein